MGTALKGASFAARGWSGTHRDREVSIAVADSRTFRGQPVHMCCRDNISSPVSSICLELATALAESSN